jgi:putative membrane protein
VFGMNVDLAQIALGELMLDKSEDESVRAFAERMVEEHGQLLAAFTEQAGLHGIAPVEEPGPVELRLHEYLSGLSGWELDLEYMNAQVIFHDNWYKRIEFVGHNGRDDAVRELAAAGHVGGMAHHDSAYGIVLGRRD